jgi:hypothetical protein
MRCPLSIRTMLVLLAVLLLLAVAGESAGAQEGETELVLCFRHGADAVCFPRPLLEPPHAQSEAGIDLVARLERVLVALIAGPTAAEQAAGVWSAIPVGSHLEEVSVDGTRLSIRLELPEAYLRDTLNPLLSDQLVEQVAKTLDPFRAEVIQAAGVLPGSPEDRLVVHILARDQREADHPR